MKKKCYLDKRYNCVHPELKQNCELHIRICEEMKPFHGEWHEVLECEAFLKKHPKFRACLVKVG